MRERPGAWPANPPRSLVRIFSIMAISAGLWTVGARYAPSGPHEMAPGLSKSQSVAAFLQPPYPGTAPENSIFDHYQNPGQADADKKIVAFTGAEATYNCPPGQSPPPGSDGIHCFDNADPTFKLIYWSYSIGDWLSYDEHHGIDYGIQYQPVFAAADSDQVVAAGWADPQDHTADYGLSIRLHHLNGYQTIYGHLSAIAVGCIGSSCPGQGPRAGQVIGISGNTGNSRGPHLHFEVRNASGYAVDPYGWTGAGDDPWVRNQPDSLWLSNPSVKPSSGTTVLPTGPELPYPSAPSGGLVVDDGDDGFSEAPAGCWTIVSTTPSQSVNGSMRWTTPRTQAPATCTARWAFPPTLWAGNYEVYVHIPSVHATSTGAVYTIAHNGHLGQAVIDQELFGDPRYTLEQWVYVGLYDFAGAGEEYISLGNQTLDLASEVSSRELGADAVWFVPMNLPPSPTPTNTPTPSSTPTATPVPTSTPTPTSTPNAQGFFLTGPFQFTITTISGQQYAYHVVAQEQPAQTAFAGIVIDSDYVRNFFADAHVLGYDPSLHGASSPWDQGAGWYCRTSGWSQDADACTFASGVLGQSFNLPRPLSWNRDGWPGSTVYSALGIESVPCCSWPSVTGNFTVYYIWHSYPPTPTPSPTLEPCTCFLDWVKGLCTYQGGSSSGLRLQTMGRSLQDVYIDLTLFRRVRDEVMMQTPEGQRLVQLYDQNSLEIISILQEDPALREEGLAVLDMWQPNLQILVDSGGGTVNITPEQVQAVQSFLDHLSAEASPELQQDIAGEEERTPLQAFVGLTMSEGWRLVNENKVYLPYVTR